MHCARRLGELLAEQKAPVGLAQGSRTDLGFEKTQVKATLAEAGIDKNLAGRAARSRVSGFVP